MVRIDDAIIARLKKNGETFEVLVDCDKALEFREGKIDSLDNVLATRDIYKDVKQGEHASEKDLRSVFKTEDSLEAAAIIIKSGEIQLTTEHKNKLREEKRKQIVALISQNAIDPKSGLPHPADRIEMVMKEAKVKVDEFKSAEAQMPDVVVKLTPLIPIRIESRELEIVIPSQYTGNAYNVLNRFGTILRDKWENDGSLKITIEIPAGLQEKLEVEVSKFTKGDFDLKILKKN